MKRYCISDDIDKAVRTVITQRHKGQFKKGMLQEFVEKALIKEIYFEYGIAKKSVHPHKNSSIGQKMDRYHLGGVKYTKEYARRLNGQLHNHMLDLGLPENQENPTRRDYEKALVIMGRDRRTVKSNLALLTAFGFGPKDDAETDAGYSETCDISPLQRDLK